VKFQLNYREAGVTKALEEWAESCDGSIKEVDVDLNSLAGKTVQFALAISANGAANEDWAVWVNPQVAVP